MGQMSKDDQKEAFKEAVKEWLDEMYRQVGRWTVGAFLTAGVAGIIYLVLWSSGWRK